MESARDQLIKKISELYSNDNGDVTRLVQKYTDEQCEGLLSFVFQLSLLQPRVYDTNVLPAITNSGVFNDEATINLRQIPWNLVTSFKSSEAGSVGVFFIHIGNKNVVVKCSKSPQSELFTMALARHLNLSAPDARVVARSTPEWQEIAQKIEQLAKGAGTTSKVRASPYLLIMQFVEGICLGDFSKELAQEYFSPKDPYTSKRFQDMGKLIAFDMLVNNWDRFPYAWDNNGNIFNVMLQSLRIPSNPGKVVGIDFSTTPIMKTLGNNTPNKLYEDYFNRLEGLLVEEICGAPEHFSSGLSKVAKAFWDGFNYYPIQSDMMNLRIGILEGAVKISKICRSTLVNLIQSLPCPESYDVGVWRMGMSDISVEFLERAIEVFQKHANDADLRKAELRKIAASQLSTSPTPCLIC